MPDDVRPVIAVNRRYIPEARLFSYMHELAHLATRTEHICMTHFAGNAVEQWCEEVAGNVLLPAANLRAFVRDELKLEVVASPYQVDRIARRFNVSRRGTAYRLQKLGLGVPTLYQQIHANTDLPTPRDDDEGPRERKSLRQHRELGPTFSRLMLRAESEGLIDHHDLIDYLDLPAAQLDEWRDLARG